MQIMRVHLTITFIQVTESSFDSNIPPNTSMGKALVSTKVRLKLCQGSQQFPKTIFPDFLLKIHSFSLTKGLKKGSFSRSQDEKRPFFHDQNRQIFHFVVKKLLGPSKALLPVL